MVHSELKEVVDYFVRCLINNLPRFKVNSFAQELANSLLALFFADNATELKEQLPKNTEGYWIFRKSGYVCPLILNVLNNCAISLAELLAVISEQVYFKVEIGKVSSVCGNESKVINLAPFKKLYFEIPLRVLKVAIHQRLNMLIYRHSFDGSYPNNFIPLLLVSPEMLGTELKIPREVPMFRAVGLPMYLFSAEQLNKTTFGSHNSAQLAIDLDRDLHGPSGDARVSLFSESEKIDFFAPGWWERIVMSQVIVDYAEEAKNNSYVCNVLNLV